jgi:lysophospholipase L1-like esterase
MASVHVYGGSNTYGIGDPEGGGYASRLRSTMMSRMMEPVEGRRGVIVHNLARFGMTLPRIVETLPASLANRDGRGRLIAAAMIGFSDSGIQKSAAESTVTLDRFRRALKQFTEICSQASYPVHPLFIEYPPIDVSRPHPDNPGDIDPLRVAKYQEAVRNHAERTDAYFVETHCTLKDLLQDPISKDGIHLSVAGHIAVHDLVLHRIDSLL